VCRRKGPPRRAQPPSVSSQTSASLRSRIEIPAVRTLDAVLAMLAAGACRVGATATATIGAEWRAHGPEAVAALVCAAPGGTKVTRS
jgi:hypothetical protein